MRSAKPDTLNQLLNYRVDPDRLGRQRRAQVLYTVAVSIFTSVSLVLFSVSAISGIFLTGEIDADRDAWVVFGPMWMAVALMIQLHVASYLRNGDILEWRNHAIADHIEKFGDPAEQKVNAPVFPAEKVRAPRLLPANLVVLPVIAAVNWGTLLLAGDRSAIFSAPALTLVGAAGVAASFAGLIVIAPVRRRYQYARLAEWCQEANRHKFFDRHARPRIDIYSDDPPAWGRKDVSQTKRLRRGSSAYLWSCAVGFIALFAIGTLPTVGDGSVYGIDFSAPIDRDVFFMMLLFFTGGASPLPLIVGKIARVLEGPASITKKAALMLGVFGVSGLTVYGIYLKAGIGVFLYFIAFVFLATIFAVWVTVWANIRASGRINRNPLIYNNLEKRPYSDPFRIGAATSTFTLTSLMAVGAAWYALSLPWPWVLVGLAAAGALNVMVYKWHKKRMVEGDELQVRWQALWAKEFDRNPGRK